MSTRKKTRKTHHQIVNGAKNKRQHRKFFFLPFIEHFSRSFCFLLSDASNNGNSFDKLFIVFNDPIVFSHELNKTVQQMTSKRSESTKICDPFVDLLVYEKLIVVRHLSILLVNAFCSFVDDF